MKDKMMIIKKLTFFLLITAYCLLPALTYAVGPKEVIKAIEVEGLSRISKKELIDIICFKVGMLLTGSFKIRYKESIYKRHFP
jgi:outer membrane protein assembly factor BamA